MGGLVAYRWMTSMQNDVKLVPGQLTMGQPPGTVPREGAELVVAREVYATRKNPIAPDRPVAGARAEALRHLLHAVPWTGGKGDGLVTPAVHPARRT